MVRGEQDRHLSLNTQTYPPEIDVITVDSGDADDESVPSRSSSSNVKVYPRAPNRDIKGLVKEKVGPPKERVGPPCEMWVTPISGWAPGGLRQ